VTHIGTHEGEFIDVLPKDLTLSDARPYPVDYSHRTIFEEVKIKPFVEREYKELSDIKPVRHGAGWEKRIFEVFCDITEERFGDCVVGLSSGYDSRLIALALKNRGLEALEYVECFGEEEGFLQVVNYLGIKNYRIFESDKPIQYRLESFLYNLDGYDGVVGLHLNPFWTPFPEEVNMFTGCGANTIVGCMKSIDNYFIRMSGIKRGMDLGERVLRAKRYSYYTQLARYKIRGTALRTFSDYRFLREIAKVKNWQSDKRSFARIIIDAIDPGLGKIPRTGVQELIKRNYRILPKEIAEKIQRDYNKTEYSKYRPTSVVRLVDNHQFWAHWQAANLCEKLIEKGYNIKF